MRRGTTPVNHISTDMDLTGATALYVTYQQNDETVLEKTLQDATITEKEVAIQLSQEDTLLFEEGSKVYVQLRAVLPDGNCVASNIMSVKVEKILKDGVI